MTEPMSDERFKQWENAVATHPGCTFLAEQPDLADRCVELFSEVLRLREELNNPDHCYLRAWDFCVGTENYKKSEWAGPHFQVTQEFYAATSAKQEEKEKNDG